MNFWLNGIVKLLGVLGFSISSDGFVSPFFSYFHGNLYLSFSIEIIGGGNRTSCFNDSRM